MFECMELRKNSRVDANCASHGIKIKGGEAALPTNPDKGRAGKGKKSVQAIRAIGRPEEKHACYMAPDTPRRNVN